jgi:Ca2+-binding RTX toxin-like protein
MSRLSLESKDVYPLGQHLYVVFENDAGQEYVIRGGPQNDDPRDFGNIEVEVGVPIAQSEDARGSDTVADRGNVLLNVGNRDPGDVWHIMTQQAEEINEEGLSYRAALRAQNSNSVVSSVLHAAGLDPYDATPSNAGSGEFVGRANRLNVSSVLRGTENDDVIRGHTEDDVLYGEGGDDDLFGDRGNDTLSGGWGFDLLDGGRGKDTADYSFYEASNGLSVNLESGKVSFRPEHSYGSPPAVEKLVRIENVIGGGGNDELVGSSGSNVIRGGPGADVLRGAGGRDVIYADAEDTSVYGGKGADTFYVQSADVVDDFNRLQGDIMMFIA